MRICVSDVCVCVRARAGAHLEVLAGETLRQEVEELLVNLLQLIDRCRRRRRKYKNKIERS